MKALLERLHELGYVEGQNMTFEYRSAEGRPERLRSLAMELVQANPDVLIAGFGTLAAQAAKAATTTIPIVFATVGDPLGAGIVTSLGRPGGNVTGLTDQARDVQGKRLQLLQELIPGKHVIAVLMNPDTPFSRLATLSWRCAYSAAVLASSSGWLLRVRSERPRGCRAAEQRDEVAPLYHSIT
jgi:putative ABC transport system substrate-binding protein